MPQFALFMELSVVIYVKQNMNPTAQYAYMDPYIYSTFTLHNMHGHVE